MLQAPLRLAKLSVYLWLTGFFVLTAVQARCCVKVILMVVVVIGQKPYLLPTRSELSGLIVITASGPQLTLTWTRLSMYSRYLS